jgi:putative hydrolase of the HAD superfamily
LTVALLLRERLPSLQRVLLRIRDVGVGTMGRHEVGAVSNRGHRIALRGGRGGEVSPRSGLPSWGLETTMSLAIASSAPVDPDGRPGDRAIAVAILKLRSDRAMSMLEEIDVRGVRAVVFDAVGTLIEPDPPVAVAYASAARRQGVTLDWEIVRSRFRQAFSTAEVEDAQGAQATDETREVRRWRRIVAEVLPEVSDPERAFAELWDHFGQAAAWRTFDDVGPTLQALKTARLATCIGSNFDGRLRSVVAGLDDLSGLVDALVISSEVGWRKPHPAFYAAICRKLVLKPAHVLFVGDDRENDLEGPRMAGMKALLIDRRPSGPPLLADLAALFRQRTG